jgi:hypothetical protein
LAVFQSQVDAALTAYEWATARARWRAELESQQQSLQAALLMAGMYGIEREPLEARLLQIADELQGDVTADQVSVHPLRSVPMDLITDAVVRRLLRIPAGIPVLSVKVAPNPQDVLDAIAVIAQRWSTPNGAQPEEQTRTVSA